MSQNEGEEFHIELEMAKKRNNKIMITDEAIKKVPLIKYKEIPENEYLMLHMSETNFLSEKLEDNQAAAEWGQKQAELIKKGETITKRLTAKYIPIILEREAKEITGSDK